MKSENLDINPTGIFVGEASILYGYQIIYQITGDIKYLEYAEKHTSYLLQLLEYDTEYDLIGGNAGAILALINMYKITEKQKYLDDAIRAYEYLNTHLCYYDEDKVAIYNSFLGKPLAGVAHGCTGYAYAISKLAYYTKNKSIYELVEKLLNYEDTLYNAELHDWKDLRGGEQYIDASNAWCHGRMGIYYMWNVAKEYCDEKLKNKIKEYLNKPILFQEEIQIKETDCLCHGNMGIHEMELKRKGAMISYDKYEFLLHKIRKVEELGFMIGKSGVGYWLERRDKVLPNILLLEI